MMLRSKFCLQLGWIITIVFCLSFTSSTMLPKSNIEVLNKLIREKLLMKVIPELKKSLLTIEQLRTSSMACKHRITSSYKTCADCTKNRCYDRYRECKISSRKRVTMCEIVALDQAEICSLTDNAEKFMLNVVTNIKDRLGANLRYAIYDMGSLIETFVVHLANYANTWSSNSAFALQNAIKQIQTRYTIENNRFMADIHYRSPEEVILRDMSSAMNVGMDKLGATIPNTGSFSYDLSRTLADLLSVHFNVGRKKRAVACNTLATQQTTCLVFRDQCATCRSMPKSKPVTDVCGALYTSEAKQLVDSLTRTTQIYEEVLSRVKFVQSASYTRVAFNTPEIKFQNTKFTVAIQSKPSILFADFHVFDMGVTAGQLADKIWTDWTKNNAV
ncbi:uncharacterized protein LOC132557625 [Ylistrum balloti]|uniref:uncharacterized protein LOC132557625 n=1 Tax=Ylistrum balloti TaxID=509963 RepID=UPI002905EFF2|nr:uncharacterized protein LOC132557625 [Ylistrum balloti]